MTTEFYERPPEPRVHYVGFADESSGQGTDASRLSICHLDAEKRVIQDVVAVFKPPFSPHDVIAEKAATLQRYRVSRVTGDGWALGLVADAYRANGIRYERSETDKSTLYIAFMGLISARNVVMLDHTQQRTELLGLERRAGFGGRERVDHPALANCHDDAINSLAGAAVLTAGRRPPLKITAATLERAHFGRAAARPAPPPANANTPDAPQPPPSSTAPRSTACAVAARRRPGRPATTICEKPDERNIHAHPTFPDRPRARRLSVDFF